MFDSQDYPHPLNESLFAKWLEQGRSSPIPYTYLLVIWDELDRRYLPIYTQSRSEMTKFPRFGVAMDQRSMVAAYDLYSESRIM
ncbi:hypothetical protein ADIS_2765 [Lunatimonas lonarensis]|uniref:Uncharacterized protein n=1 Tax=Lunatimonas lonarensis TaxID=1232681 RepID=R7ZRY3_9BACT|nr:hypothetical protein [Lunatimonas lonarensis]EON76754.1 hypothetical protein ADIS_2765 [Lunatimonas lonarensis]